VRTTAYTHTEGDHLQYGSRNACGDPLQYGALRSAACDWSRWPVGTVFRIQETGDTHVVDDYGWALSGTNTIDLYAPSRSAMNSWGVRRVHIEMLRWGDVDRSLAILRPRAKHRHVRRMLDQIQERYAELSQPLEAASSSVVAAEMNAPAPPPGPVATPRAIAPRAIAVTALQPAAAASSPGGFNAPSAARVPLTPFSASATR
jgi:3D (Asp-Asp-Asp) domain-containing protein